MHKSYKPANNKYNTYKKILLLFMGLTLFITLPSLTQNNSVFAASEENTTTPACGTELIQNGSFETPKLTNPQGWDVVPSGQQGIVWNADWVDTTPEINKPTIAQVELQNGRVAEAGSQYTELDSDYNGQGSNLIKHASVKIYQNLPTIVGQTYEVSFYFSPLPGKGMSDNVLVFSWDGNIIDTITADGTVLPVTVWTRYTYTVTAKNTTTKIEFTDGGTSDSFGTLLDVVSAKQQCQSNNSGGGASSGSVGGSGSVNGASTQTNYTISGTVWNDTSDDGIKQPTEAGLAGWTVYIDTNDNGILDTNEQIVVTNGVGKYTFDNLKSGTYALREIVQGGWRKTFPAYATSGKQVVTISTANISDINFGNKSDTTINTTPIPAVLGASTILPRTGIELKTLWVMAMGIITFALVSTLSYKRVKTRTQN